jgi:hypothetical protein
MEEILQNLIKSYSENRPRKHEFKFYSNLSVTQPYHQHKEIIRSISKGVSFLEKSFHHLSGFQSSAFTSPECVELSNGKANIDNPNFDSGKVKCEQLTNILALDLMGEEFMSGVKISVELLEDLKSFIVPECGISTFNLFRWMEVNADDDSSESSSAVSVSSNSCEQVAAEESFVPFTLRTLTEEEEASHDSGHDSSSSSPLLSIPGEEEEEDSFPDDCNTTSLAVSLLLREGLLDYHPAASITELILSNTVPDNIIETSSAEVKLVREKGLPKHPGVLRTFLDGRGLDPSTCANALYLYYSADMDLNNEENVEITEIFLVQTLKRLLTLEGTTGMTDEVEGDLQEDDSTLQLHHHSPDALLFFLSRVISISPHAKYLFEDLLIALLSQRIGLPSNPLDLAMRILAAGELNLLTHQNESGMGNCISKDYQALISLQNDEDGSWPEGSLISVKYGTESSKVFFGGKEISTIFACKALDIYFECMRTRKTQERHAKEYLY